MKFMHIADVHLGYQQYGLGERFDDFSNTLLYLTQKAIEENVDFILLAGDFFHNRTMEPRSLWVALEGLRDLKQAEIPVLAVEGNHERAFYQEKESWMDFLDNLGLIKLLSPRFESGTAIIDRYQDDRGTYVDLDNGVRVYGIKYFGSSIGKAIRSFGESLQKIDHSGVTYSILMMHAGLEGQLAYSGRLMNSDLAILRNKIDYVALGHIHKPYEVDNWIFNPGSPETCSIDELDWPERGYYLVEIQPDSSNKHHAKLMTLPRREFYRLRLGVDGFSAPNDVYDGVRSLIENNHERINSSENPVIQLTLGGILPFNRYELDLDYIKSLLVDAWDPLIAKVNSNITPAELEITVDSEASRSEVERDVIRELFERNVRFREKSIDWALGAIRLKRLIQEGNPKELIVENLDQLQKELS